MCYWQWRKGGFRLRFPALIPMFRLLTFFVITAFVNYSFAQCASYKKASTKEAA